MEQARHIAGVLLIAAAVGGTVGGCWWWALHGMSARVATALIITVGVALICGITWADAAKRDDT